MRSLSPLYRFPSAPHSLRRHARPDHLSLSLAPCQSMLRARMPRTMRPALFTTTPRLVQVPCSRPPWLLQLPAKVKPMLQLRIQEPPSSTTMYQSPVPVKCIAESNLFSFDNGLSGIEVGSYTALLIQAVDGTFQLAAGKEVSVSFPQSGASTQFPDPHGGLISDFTTYGPSNYFHFKPAIAAPGGNILSTYPVPMGTYAVLSGTSMATPFGLKTERCRRLARSSGRPTSRATRTRTTGRASTRSRCRRRSSRTGRRSPTARTASSSVRSRSRATRRRRRTSRAG
ncbi:hypothetical protein LXA43DRAFT_913577 [Ganoderma leucocontextum]|nr:hypothetical protein LXA43DRAFT_913577 [Ganoderma leucocontextum]